MGLSTGHSTAERGSSPALRHPQLNRSRAGRYLFVPVPFNLLKPHLQVPLFSKAPYGIRVRRNASSSAAIEAKFGGQDALLLRVVVHARTCYGSCASLAALRCEPRSGVVEKDRVGQTVPPAEMAE
eukprot:3659078-Rhodomonas_salina.2